MRPTLVITTIAAPTEQVRAWSRLSDLELVVIGDVKTPQPWSADNAQYLDVELQERQGLQLAALLPKNHYARKNLGYLVAARSSPPYMIDTDDDNAPAHGFPAGVKLQVSGEVVEGAPWVNPYAFFTSERIWPRGLPLDCVVPPSPVTVLPSTSLPCEVQQYLAEGDPDVDAVYRMTVNKADHVFRVGGVIIGRGSYTPFNSQSTVWFPPAWPLMYLPSHVNFRMTDIWRSFVALRCMHAAGQNFAYRGPGVHQVRNAHNLMNDFIDEMPGYLQNAEIVRMLEGLALREDDFGAHPENLLSCYSALVAAGFVPPEELPLVEAWLADWEQVG